MKTNYSFKFSKLIYFLFAGLIALLVGNIVFNVLKIANTKIETSFAIFILSIAFSVILLLFCLMVFFFSRYKILDDKLLVKFGFITVLKIEYKKISRIGKHSVTNEVFVVFAARENFATHLLCTEEKFADEIVSRILKNNPNIEYFSGK